MIHKKKFTLRGYGDNGISEQIILEVISQIYSDVKTIKILSPRVPFFSKSCLTNKLILGLNYSYDANYIFSISKFIGYIDVGDKCWRRNMLVITGFNRFCRRPRCCRHKDFVAFISNLSLRHNRQQHRHQHHRNTAQTQSLYPIFFCKQKQNFGCIAIFIARKLI